MKIIFIGDIVGRPGRRIVRERMKGLRKDLGADAVIANAENAAGGSGLVPRLADKLFRSGLDVMTSGDHIWKRRQIYTYLDSDKNLLRPANYPEGSPGRGHAVVDLGGIRMGVINLVGRVFMEAVDCPFARVRQILPKMRKQTHIILVDMHAEATSEKVAMGWFLDGSVSAVVGTHTHVQTADEKVLPKGTAYITDCGMTGPFDSVIGRKKENILARFVTQLPTRFEMASEDVQMHGVLIDVDEDSGKARNIERIQVREE